VVVIGGGYGGATAAKYVRLLSDYKIDVVLIEPNDAFMCRALSPTWCLAGTQADGRHHHAVQRPLRQARRHGGERHRRGD
jgi:NADH dehydrogenase FAD-containing subunit